MNARGQYGNNLNGQSRAYVGARLVHTLELKQRYDNAKTVAVQALLNELSSDGVVSSVGTNRWEIALKDGAWVQLTWYPEYSALEVTITDRELRPVEHVAPARRSYEAILRKITPRLRTYGATTVGAAIYAGQQVQQQPRFAARTRAIKAVFDMYTRRGGRVPYYLYAEINGAVDKRSSSSLDEANALFAALERSPGEVYVAIFDPTDPLWPGPALDVYHGVPQVPQERPIVGITVYHSVGDRADAVKQMAIDWSALYASLAPQAGAVMDPTAGVTTSAVQKLREEELAAWKVVDSLRPLEREVERIEKLLNAAGVDKKMTTRWRNESIPPYADIVMIQLGKNEGLKQQFIAAKTALDNFMPKAQRNEADRRAGELTRRRQEAVMQTFDPKKVQWWNSYAAPLFNQWNKFRREQLGDYTTASDYIAFAERWQTNWDVYEDWRKKLDKLRAEAVTRGFTVDAPKPMDLPTTVWADVAHTVERGAGAVAGGIGDVWKLAKYGAWAVLGIGAVVALSSVVSNLRSGKDPAEKYVGLIKPGKRTAARAALPARAQLALPPGKAAMEGA